MSECFFALGESWLQNYAPAADASVFWSGHEHR
jgi:hypothetical protein